uniref:Uncharacterized protein n=1 Tax=Avena sativa TaxID=4498 RepID=A0ACD5YIE9_AVESA
MLVANLPDISHIILDLLAQGHPTLNLNFLFTFLWCLWKSRNDNRFNRKAGLPQQVVIQSFALINNLEASSLVPDSKRISSPANLGLSVPSDFHFTGPKLYADASWKLRPPLNLATAGLGVYFAESTELGRTDVFILASIGGVESALQAEAHAMLLATHFASALKLKEPVFFTDCLNFAKSAVAPGVKDHEML